MCAKKITKVEREVPTTGHDWDGIQELDNPMPRWWVWVFYACIVWGIGYTIAYPAWPLLTRATQGVIGNNERANVAAEIADWNARNAGNREKLVATDLNAIGDDPQLAAFAENAGAAVFRTNCVQCHGAGAAGIQSLGYPNLLDDDWLWGGSMEAIHQTVSHGIRNTTDPDARYSQMPAFGKDQLLEKPQIAEVVEYVLQLSGQEHDATLASAGATVFADNCSSCHAETGKGDREQGAPDLTDAVWLYGGSREAITYSVNNARFGVMPDWAGRLSEADIRAVSWYVHSLGGGE
ncbi:cytochrome-c oxidase, cbb3-type subunit III [Pseudomonas sp. GX19020]|uniref:cytochrome-c oxidase, cbb3-type subunit III n=1 Tax=Pseudomonadota TaxID=1224 RepID=UPI00089428D7|nr:MULTISPECIES: cytochrome-c oxidase, cbb3-type subunit III [Pseudomonadota]MCL4065973.1 cytochrome-c oxidase, cbb3-type subunit III [Pseudomonas sp. GX19020]SEC74703.1 cytochrome c oxidase cbb3-type subunit 3 [Rhodobacter sp. 24-YEA-8]